MKNWGIKTSLTATSAWFDFQGNNYLLVLITLHWIMEFWKIHLYLRQLSVARKAVIPPPLLTGRLTAAEYRVMRSSSIARCIATIIASSIFLAIKTLKLVLNYHPFLWELTHHYGETPIGRAAWYAAFDELYGKLLFLPFAILGMLLSAKSIVGVTTLILFLASLIEVFFVAAIAASTMMFLVLLTDHTGSEVLFYTPMVSNFIGLVTMAVFIQFIVPLNLQKVGSANRRLKETLAPITSNTKFPIDKIYIDPYTSSLPNAYFSGIFGANMIAVTPALIEIMDKSQVAAVVAHELGHWAHHHNSVQILFSLVTAMCVSYGLFQAYDNPTITKAFRFQDQPQAMIPVYLWVSYGSPLVHDFIDGINSIVGYSCEYTADRFAIAAGMGRSLKAALLTLAAKSMAFPLFDKWYSAWFLKHPAILDRIRRIDLAN